MPMTVTKLVNEAIKQITACHYRFLCWKLENLDGLLDVFLTLSNTHIYVIKKQYSETRYYNKIYNKNNTFKME